MPFRTALLVLAAALAAPAFAQGPPGGGSVTARVVDDATGEPLPQATLALYSARDSSFATGGAADVDGAVRIDPVRPGAYVARVSFVGYTSRTIRDVAVAVGAPTDLGEVRLEVSAAELGEAEVTARRQFVEQQADRTVYNVQEQAVTAGGSAIETLQTLPSLEVDTDGNISLRGNQNVVIQINGRPVPVRGAFLAALLRQIPADKVQRVEVIPNPSAKYEPDGMSGIVNIVLAEGTDRGLSGGLTFGGGTELSGQAGANLSYQRGKWDTNVQYGYRYGQRDVLITAESAAASGAFATTTLGTTGSDESSHFVNGSATYSLAEKTTLSAEGSFGIRDSGSDGLTDFSRTINGGSPVATSRQTDNDQGGLNGDAALVFRRQFENAGGGDGGQAGGGGGGRRGGPMGFGGPRGGAGTQSDHELAVETRYTRFENDNAGLFFDLASGGALTGVQSQATDQANNEASFQVDYTRPIGALKLEVGGRASTEWVSSASEFLTGDTEAGLTIDPNQTNAFDYDRQIGAVYVQGARPVGPLQVQVGLRAETASRSFDLLTPIPPEANRFYDTTAPTSLSYTSLFPSAFATYAFGPGTLVKGSYSRRIDRPRTFFLNPFPDLSDTTFVRVGNPALLPAYTDSYELTLQYKFFATLTPFFRRTTDVIERRAFVDPVTGNGVFSVSNLGSQTNYGADLTLFGQFGPVRGFVSGSLYQAVLADPSVIEDVEALNYNARTSLQVKVREGTDVQGFVFYNGPQPSVDGKRKGFAFSSIGLNQRITESLSLAARVNDPFGLAKFEFETDSGQVFRFTEFNPGIRQASFTLTYTFGSNPRRPQQQPQQPQGGLDGGIGF